MFPPNFLPMKHDLPWKKAIDRVLAEASCPLHYQEIAKTIIDKGYRTTLGATPATTVHTLLSSSLKNEGPTSPYQRMARGMFSLKPIHSPNSEPHETHATTPLQANNHNLAASKPKPSDYEEEDPEILTSFGMFWRRDAIEWTGNPKLLGMQQLGATPVDFCRQLGIYLLYDGREVIYVGRSTDRPLGRRLYEHTLDRLSTRWDRFSWFGILPVTEEGHLTPAPENYPAEALIPAFEALLIEALEPRQNRKRGDDLAAVEYLQKISPEIEKKRVKTLLDEALNKL
jgi:hypothetical protein